MAFVDQSRKVPPRLRPGPNGLPRGRVTEIQRSRMLAATLEAVEAVGYGRMTVAQVIGRAKVSRKTFYDVFADREDCFLAAFDHAKTGPPVSLGRQRELDQHRVSGHRLLLALVIPAE